MLTTLMAADINAQVKPIDQTFVSLAPAKAWEITEVFKSLESHTDYVFVFPDDLLKNIKRILLDGNRQSVNDILVQIAKHSPLKFKQVNNSIYVGGMEQTDNA